MRYLYPLVFLAFGLPVVAGQFDADVVILGEFHDNPHHHSSQAEIVADIKPKALVFEMLTTAQAAAHIPGADAATMEKAFGWADSGWPDFAMYSPIFAAAPDARIFGAGVPREAARRAMTDGVSLAFGIGAEAYGLTIPLDPAEQKAREEFQMAAHCDALPPDMLAAMVDIQRLRDAELAKMAVRALQLTGGPVVVITGNGHARTDWGMGPYLARVEPHVSVIAVGQSESGVPPQGTFDHILDSPSVPRDDPCAAFKTSN